MQNVIMQGGSQDGKTVRVDETIIKQGFLDIRTVTTVNIVRVIPSQPLEREYSTERYHITAYTSGEYIAKYRPTKGADQRECFMIGQRVVYHNVICTIERFENGRVWIDNPEKGYSHWVDLSNLKPLPNGML